MRALRLILGCVVGVAAARGDDPPAGAGDFPAPGDAPKAPAAKVQWADSFDAAISQAKESRKLVMVDFYTTWCGPCKMLERQTYGNAKVAAALGKDFISVKVDCEAPTGEPIAEKYKVSAFPTVMFLDGEGKVVHKHLGFIEAQPFLDKLAGLGDVRDLPKLEAQAKKNPGDGPLAARIISAHCMQGDVRKAKEFLAKAVEAGLQGVPLAKAHNKIGDHHQEAEEYEEAIGHFRKAEKAGDPREKGYALISIGACSYSEGKLAAAKSAVADALEIPGLPADLKEDGRKMLQAIEEAAKQKDDK